MSDEQSDVVQRLEAERLRPTPKRPRDQVEDAPDAAANRARLEAALNARRRTP